jgi:N-acetylglucosaminyldiphosphoundecaprenol N-acetyl-beta-D-mannosaminyltransferase
MHATLEATAPATATETPTFKVLGVRVDAVQIPDAIRVIEQWIAQRDGASRYVAVTGMHGVSESLVDKPFRAMLDGASMVVSDGMPLVWLGRWHGYKNMVRRVYGPELMETFCRETGSHYRHFF